MRTNLDSLFVLQKLAAVSRSRVSARTVWCVHPVMPAPTLATKSWKESSHGSFFRCLGFEQRFAMNGLLSRIPPSFSWAGSHSASSTVPLEAPS